MNNNDPITQLLDFVKLLVVQEDYVLPLDFFEQLPPYSVLLPGLLDWAASPIAEDESYHEAFTEVLRGVLQELRIDLRRGSTEADECGGTLDERLLNGLASDHALLGGLLLHAMAELDFVLSESVIDAANDWQLQCYQNMAPEEPIGLSNDEQKLQQEARWRDILAELEPETAGDFYEFLRPQLHYLPLDNLEAFVEGLLTSDTALVRGAGLLFLLHARAAVRECALQALDSGAAIDGIDARGRNRLVMLRNWLPASQAQTLDSIIRKLAQRNLQPAPDTASHLKLWASAMDGSGASGLAAIETRGGRYRFSAAILKENKGILDCVQSPWVRKSQAEESLRMFRQHLPALLPVSTEFLQLFIPHFLTANRDSGTMPEPLLLDWLEVLGDGLWQPNALDARDWLERHADELGSLDQDAAFRRLQRWFDREQENLHWFEQDEDVERFIEGVFADIPPPPDELVGPLLEPYRLKWFKRFVQLTIWAKSSNSNKKPQWQDFALLARALDEGAPIAELPILPAVAITSIQAYLARAEADLDAEDEAFHQDQLFDSGPFEDDLFDGPALPARSERIGRNEPCPCGSGKKYKKCCMD